MQPADLFIYYFLGCDAFIYIFERVKILFESKLYNCLEEDGLIAHFHFLQERVSILSNVEDHLICLITFANVFSFFFSVHFYQARYFFQQLISGVSYCHSMVLIPNLSYVV